MNPLHQALELACALEVAGIHTSLTLDDKSTDPEVPNLVLGVTAFTFSHSKPDPITAAANAGKIADAHGFAVERSLSDSAVTLRFTPLPKDDSEPVDA